MVLFGLMRGLSLCLPNLRPAKYAPLSAAQITSSAISNQRWPLGCPPWISASAHQAGTTASVPAASLNMRACVSWSEAKLKCFSHSIDSSHQITPMTVAIWNSTKL